MKNKINFYDGFIQDDVIWFSSLNHNALMTLDIKSGKIDAVGRFPGCENYQKNLHIRVIEEKRCLYFVPRNGNFVHVFNLENMTFEENIPLPYSDDTCIANAVMDKLGRIWIIPAYIRDGIVVLDTNRKCAEKSGISEPLQISSNAFVGPNCVCYNSGIISICIFKSNVVFYIDTIEYEMSAEKIDEEYKPYSFISDNGITYIFSNYPDNRIIFWNKNDKIDIDISDKLDSNNEMYLYWNYIRKDNKFMCIPYDRDDLLVIDMLEKRKKYIPINEFVKKNSSNPMYSFYKEYKGCFYLFPSGADGLLIIDGNDWSIRTLDYVINDELQTQIQAECKDNFKNEMLSGIVSENVEYDETLGDFLDFVTQNSRNQDAGKKTDYGNKIYKNVKKYFSKN